MYILIDNKYYTQVTCVPCGFLHFTQKVCLLQMADMNVLVTSPEALICSTNRFTNNVNDIDNH